MLLYTVCTRALTSSSGISATASRALFLDPYGLGFWRVPRRPARKPINVLRTEPPLPEKRMDGLPRNVEGPKLSMNWPNSKGLCGVVRMVKLNLLVSNILTFLFKGSREGWSRRKDPCQAHISIGNRLKKYLSK